MDIRRTLTGLMIVTAALLFGGCGDADGSAGHADMGARADGGGAAASKDGLSVPAAMRAFANDGKVFEIRIEANDQMKYDTDGFSVAPGQMVRLTLEHVGTLPAGAMGHNVVMIQAGEDFMEFAADANEQGANHTNAFVPEPVRDRVIAYTALIGGGQSATVEFKAPQDTGEYPFLCTFPGHGAQMNGIMTVER